MTKRPHGFFTDAEWEDLERVMRRWSDAGRAKEQITYPAAWELIKATYEEDRDAAEAYHDTVARILKAAARRRLA